MRNDIRDQQVTPTTSTASHRPLTCLHWWRTLPPASFTKAHLNTLAAALARLAIIRERQWPAAVAGDGAAAVGIALRMTRGDYLTPAIEVAMTALLRPAVAGDPAACLVLASVIGRLVGGSESQRLSTCWLAHAGLLPNDSDHLADLTFKPSDENCD